jgi:hypothetical protein
MNKKGYDLVARRHRWLTRFVDQMNGNDAFQFQPSGSRELLLLTIVIHPATFLGTAGACL